jgi:iron(III) transport system permease protein
MRRRSGAARGGRWPVKAIALPVLIAAGVLVPVLVVASALIAPTGEVWRHLWNTVLPLMLANTFLLLLGVGLGTLVLGAGLAWVVTAYEFPGRSAFEWLLLLPMAVPAYVIGFVYMATFDAAGPVQGFLRAWAGGAVWFPEIRSPGGAILVMTLVLYPYVYMLARAGFRGISASSLEAARVLGYGPVRFFFRVAFPLSRPAIAAGVILALMEAMADFATVRFFNFPTLADGVIRVWHGLMDLRAAGELAGLLAILALAAILIERSLRGRSRYHEPGGRSPGIPRAKLAGGGKWALTALCSLVVGAAFVIPVGQLAGWSVLELRHLPTGAGRVYLELAANSLVLSSLAAVVAVALALLLAGGVRLGGGKAARGLAVLATTGYAVPGAVFAVGILLTLTPLDHALNAVLERWAGFTPGLVLTGSLVGLTYGYVARFLAVAYHSTEAALEKIRPNVTLAARVLGAGSWRVLGRIHLPLAAPGLIAGAALVFVDVMKELPITVMLRPFGYDTLATWVWQMAAESLWTGAAVPALAIVAVGLLPVVLLTRATAEREGTR